MFICEKTNMILVFAALFAVAVEARRVNAVTNDTINFVEGLAVGLETEFSKNLTTCLKDETTIMTDFDVAYTEIKHGLENFSVKEIEYGLRALSDGVAEAATAFNDCGADSLFEDLNKIAMLLQGGPWKWVELIALEIANILSHEHSLGAYFRNAVKSWDKKDFYNSGVYTGLAIGLLIKDNPSGKLQFCVKQVRADILFGCVF